MSRHKTPLRYPGGKQRLSPFVCEVLGANDLLGGEYAEPYAGGGGVGIELLLTDKISHFHLNDSCVAIYSFWRSILNDTDNFCRRIMETPLTVEEWLRQKEIVSRPDEFDQLDVGFGTFYLNRCNRSGIIAGGGLIGGLHQSGEWRMDVRFPHARLVDRIKAIASKKAAITVTSLDAEDFITELIPILPERLLVYFDPPYYEKAERLYFNHYAPRDHRRIARAIQKLNCNWMVSYDNVAPIRNLYRRPKQFVFSLQYNAGPAYKGREVFFFSRGLKIPKTSSLPTVNHALNRFWKIHPTTRTSLPAGRNTRVTTHR